MGKEKCNEGRRNGRTWTRTTWRRIKLLIKVASGEFTGCVSRGMGINKPRFQRNSSYFVLDSFLLRNNVMAGLLGVSKTRQLSLPNALLLRSNNVSSHSLSPLSSNEAISTNGASSIDACLLSHLFLSVIPIFAAPRAGVSILQPWCHGYQRIAMVGVLWNLWSW